MKNLIKFSVVLVFSLSVNKFNAQVLIGKWQADTNKIGDLFLDCYYFYPNNKFTYAPNQYNGLNRFISFSGTYKISDKIIEFTILKSKERVGGTYFRDHTLSENDSWVIDNFKISEFEVKNSIDEAEIKILSKTTISIDNRLFYKVNNKTDNSE